jgi:hypothetical protein
MIGVIRRMFQVGCVDGFGVDFVRMVWADGRMPESHK